MIKDVNTISDDILSRYSHLLGYDQGCHYDILSR